MDIRPAINDLIIIHAETEAQVRLLNIIYASINHVARVPYRLKSGVVFGSKECEIDLENMFRTDRQENIKSSLLYCPNKFAVKRGVTFAKAQIEKYKEKKQTSKHPQFDYILKTVDLHQYEIISMKKFMISYGKYMFNCREEEFIAFQEKFSELEVSSMFQSLKLIKF